MLREKGLDRSRSRLSEPSVRDHRHSCKTHDQMIQRLSRIVNIFGRPDHLGYVTWSHPGLSAAQSTAAECPGAEYRSGDVSGIAIAQDWRTPAGYLVRPLQKASGHSDRSFLQFPLLDRNTSIHIIVEESNNGLGICPQLRRHAYAIV